MFPCAASYCSPPTRSGPFCCIVRDLLANRPGRCRSGFGLSFSPIFYLVDYIAASRHMLYVPCTLSKLSFLVDNSMLFLIGIGIKKIFLGLQWTARSRSARAEMLILQSCYLLQGLLAHNWSVKMARGRLVHGCGSFRAPRIFFFQKAWFRRKQVYIQSLGLLTPFVV